jgi:putative addiction module killer protein
VIEVQQTLEFAAWHAALRDERAARKIADRIFRLRTGLWGDVKFFGGLGELRIDYGPGYRVYFVKRNNVLVVLLCGGDKSSQERDIKLATRLAEEL